MISPYSNKDIMELEEWNDTTTTTRAVKMIEFEGRNDK